MLAKDLHYWAGGKSTVNCMKGIEVINGLIINRSQIEELGWGNKLLLYGFLFLSHTYFMPLLACSYSSSIQVESVDIEVSV